MIEGYQPRDESVHLRFGQEYHTAIQEYDIARASGSTFDEAVHLAIRNLLTRTVDWDVDRDTRAGNYKNRETLVALAIDYFDFFKDDPAQTFILENGKPAVELSFKFELDWGPKYLTADILEPIRMTDFGKKEGKKVGELPIQPYLLCGHLDRVVTFNDSLFVLDHKTTTTTPGPYFFNQFEPNNQMTLYSLAGQIVIDSPVRGVIIEAAQILLDKPNRFVRGFTYRTQDQLNEWIRDLKYTLSLAESFAEANHWPMNDESCGKYGGCKFREVCSKSPSVRKTWLKSDFIQLEPSARWNPLISREK